MRLFSIALAAILAALVVAMAAAVGAGPLVLGGLAGAICAVAIAVARARDGSKDGASRTDPGNAAGHSSGFGRAVLEQMPVPLLVVSDKGGVIYANPAASGLSRGLREGDHISSVMRAPRFVGAVTETLADGIERNIEVTQPGTSRVYEALVSPLPPDVLLGADARAIIRIEDRSQARRDAQSRSDFVANASHELRTPLASLLGYIETLQGHARHDDQARERFLGIMEKQARRMQRLVDDLMSLSRIEQEEHIRPSDIVDLGEVFRETVSALGPVAEKQGARIVNALDSGALHVIGDRDQLLQVAVNLVDNAIKHGGTGNTIEIARNEAAGEIGISVTDSGPGISSEHVDRLTERFYRVNTGASREAGGTGLGLAIVKHILNRHGGRMEVMATPGRGSVFTVWLPALDDSVENVR